MIRCWALVVVLCTTAAADSKTAAVHNKQGKAYFDAKQYDAAIDEFKKSYDAEKKPITLFKIASAYYAKGDYAAAIDYYGQYLQADPDGPYAKEAIEFSTIANKELADRKAKAEEAERVAKQQAEAKRQAEEAEKKRAAADGHVKNAEAFIKAQAWVSAGDEYRAASDADGEPAHLFDAAEAYRNADPQKASDAYRAYLDRVPSGGKSEEARTKLAEQARAIEAKRVADVKPPEQPVEPPPKPRARGWTSFGPRAAAGISMGNTNPLKMNSEGLASKLGFEVGGFGRYQFADRVGVRPELSFVRRSAGFDTSTMNDAVTIDRSGLVVDALLVGSLTSSIRIGGGPFVGLMVFNHAGVKAPGMPVDNFNPIDIGALIAIEVSYGMVSFEARYERTLAGKIAGDFDTALSSLFVGLALGFDRH